ncbi:MAG: hypothetical protein ACLPYY_22025 [Acidimicrobiales bacterium]
MEAADDEHGTLEQLDRIEGGVTGAFRRCVLSSGGSVPHVSQSEAVLEAVLVFASDLG